MIEVRKAVFAYLNILHPSVFFQDATDDAQFPYIIYDIPSIFCDGEGFEVVTLDIEGWDSNDTGDTTIIENLMKTINSLDKKVLSTDDMSVVFYLESKLSLRDDDKRIKRRKYTYYGRLINKN